METPLEGLLAINTDAALTTGHATGAMIAQIFKGEVVFLATKRFDPQTAEQLEIRTFEWAMEVAKSKDWPRVDWRCDAQRVVNQVQANATPSSWDSWELLWNIRNGLAGNG